MGSRFAIVGLAGEQVARALPVIQATWPGIDLPAWERFVLSFGDAAASGSGPAAGMVALHDGGGTVCGVLAYRRDQDLRGRATLAVPLFTAIDLANSPRTVRALLDAAEALASELRCGQVEIRLYEEQGEFVSRLRELGLTADTSLLRLKVEPPRAVC
jgi:hypothetical protein